MRRITICDQKIRALSKPQSMLAVNFLSVALIAIMLSCFK
jgi:hypothetical protein